jgi:outer membrane PBP1 activator LpoA protein
MSFPRPARDCVLAILLSFLAACAAPPGRPEASGELRTAQRLEQAGDHAAAAQIYLQLAARSPAPLRQTYEMRAADSLLRGGETESARSVLETTLIPPGQAPTLHAEHQILLGRLALAEDRPKEALHIAERLQIQGLPASTRAAAEDLRAQAYAREGLLVPSLEARMALQPLLTDPEAQWENEKILWQGLMGLPRHELQRWQGRETRPQARGWLDLASLARRGVLQGPGGTEAIAEWRSRYPNHPASVQALLALPAASAHAELGRQEVGLPTQVALLLPLAEGPLAGPAAAVRDGLLAAYYAQPPQDRPTVRVYDTAGDASRVQEVYRQAVQDGAQLVVGPLTKDGVQAFADARSLPVPTLALNFVDAPAPPADLYQFGLSPEDEAREVAERAWRDSHRAALALAPDTEWGSRVLQAFRSQWEQLGGVLTASARFHEDPQSVQTAVQQLAQSASAAAGGPAAPSDRSAADFVFMAAFPRQAVEMPPLLKFQLAGNLPVYTTSHSYTNALDSAARRDLQDVVLCDMPWMSLQDNPDPELQRSLEAAWPQAGGSLARLYALGVDAYALIPELTRLQSSPSETYRGVTGTLSLDSARHVRRQLVCARFAEWGHPDGET